MRVRLWWGGLAATIAIGGGAGMTATAQPGVRPESSAQPASHETREVRVSVGAAARVFTLADLKALEHVTVPGYSVVGVKKGPLGVHTWTGVSLGTLLLRVDPALSDARHAGRRIVVTSVDGYRATLHWAELFGALPVGAALYNVKGCNECHGVQGEGTSPEGKRPAPALQGGRWSVEQFARVLRAGGEAHGGLRPYTTTQVTNADLEALLGWLRSPKSASGVLYSPPRAQRGIILAYQRDGKPLSGSDGLIQLIVGPDEFAGRYAHWVSTVDVE